MPIGTFKNTQKETINKYGANFDIDAGPEDIWAHGGLFPFLDAGIAMDIVSDSGNDALAGSGAQKVRITYYNTDNTKNVVDFDLNGLTEVEVDDDIKICTRIEVIQSGVSRTNEGEINLIDRATGLVVYQSIEIGEGQTLSAVQICPKNKKGLVKKHIATYAKTQSPAGSADMRLNLRKANGTILVKHPIVISTIKPSDVVEYDPNNDESGIEMEAGDVIYWTCLIVSATNTPIEGRFDIEFTNI
jgi:hypothetical protein